MKYIYPLLMVVLVLVGACQIKNPVLPKWDVELNLPLINQRFYVSDLTSNAHLVTDSTNTLVFTTSGNAESDEFGPVFFTPNTTLDSVPIPGTGQELFIPFVDDNGVAEPAYAEILNGLVRTRFTNVNPGVQVLKLVFHNIHNAQGEEFSIAYNGNNGWISNDLSGLYLGSETADQVLSELPVSLVVTPALPQGTVAANFSLQLNSLLQFSKFRGHLNDYALTMQSSLGGIDISYPYGIDQAVQLQEASLKVYLKNYIGFSAKFSGRIKATNEQGETRYIDILDDNGNNYFAPPATGDQPGEITLDFHNNVSYLLQIMPTHVEMVDGVLTITSGQGIGDVEMDDKIFADYLINAPMSFVFQQHEIVIRDEQEFNIPESNRDRIRKNALSAELQLHVQNQLPIGATAKVYFSTSPTLVAPDQSVIYTGFAEQMTLHSSEVNSGWQNINLVFDKNELNVFTGDNVYMRWAFSFEDSDGPVTLYASPADFIHVQGMMSARIRVEE